MSPPARQLPAEELNRRLASDRVIEEAMAGCVIRVLMESGTGFAYAGRNVALMWDDHELMIDLLFYNYRLYRFMVVQLRHGGYRPEFGEALDTYLSLADQQLTRRQDGCTFGLLLCHDRHRVQARYDLGGMTQAPGVAGDRVVLPVEVSGYLPSIEQIEAELTSAVQGSRSTN